MGYSFYIGQKEVDEEYIKELKNEGVEDITKYPIHRVKKLILQEAPAFPGDELSDHNNGRHTSYSAWPIFCREAGLTDLFFNKEKGCLIMEHPGIVRITPLHWAEVRGALLSYQTKYPDAHPEVIFPNNTNYIFYQFTEAETINYHLIRLSWLDWWFHWALMNCLEPSFYNS